VSDEPDLRRRSASHASPASPAGGRTRVAGVDLDVVTLADALERIGRWVREGQTLRVVVGVNVDLAVRAAREPEFAALLARVDLVTADGAPVVWASRLGPVALPERVPTIDIFDALLPLAAQQRWPLYLLGARPEVLALAEARLVEQHPGLSIVGRHNGYFDDGAAVARDVARSGARALFLALPSPAKERFVAAHRQVMPQVRVAMGIGGTLDVVAGVTRRAPMWARRAGLEWGFRLAQEPRRLWRRYLVEDPAFLGLVVSDALERRRRGPGGAA
jgi:N-acetylglucosaminyldiphosphoundecaprenol N-acetyl-beta-D-mannosaminyltransferase